MGITKIHKTLTKTNEEHILNFRMIKPTEKFNFSEPLLNSSKLGLIRLSSKLGLIRYYNLMFNVNRRNNQFLYASTVIDNDGALAEPHISNNHNNTDSNITSVLNYN